MDAILSSVRGRLIMWIYVALKLSIMATASPFPVFPRNTSEPTPEDLHVAPLATTLSVYEGPGLVSAAVDPLFVSTMALGDPNRTVLQFSQDYIAPILPATDQYGGGELQRPQGRTIGQVLGLTYNYTWFNAVGTSAVTQRSGRGQWCNTNTCLQSFQHIVIDTDTTEVGYSVSISLEFDLGTEPVVAQAAFLASFSESWTDTSTTETIVTVEYELEAGQYCEPATVQPRYSFYQQYGIVSFVMMDADTGSIGVEDICGVKEGFNDDGLCIEYLTQYVGADTANWAVTVCNTPALSTVTVDLDVQGTTVPKVFFGCLGADE